MFCEGGCCRMIGRLQLCVLLAAVARANEKVVAVPSATVPCPPYSPTCGNTWTGTANVGDTCFEACQVNSGDNPPTRWCPTTSDTSGNDGTPWGWCSQNPGEGGSGGKDAADVEEGTSIFSIAVIASCLLYVVGGFAYSWQTKKEIVHPHMQLWRVTLGLVKDGVAWTSAKAGGQEYKGVAPVYGEIPGAETPNYGAVSHIDIVPAAGGANDFMVQEMDSPVSTPRGSSAGGTPRKKKKKKKRGPKNAAGG